MVEINLEFSGGRQERKQKKKFKEFSGDQFRVEFIDIVIHQLLNSFKLLKKLSTLLLAIILL